MWWAYTRGAYIRGGGLYSEIYGIYESLKSEGFSFRVLPKLYIEYPSILKPYTKVYRIL